MVRVEVHCSRCQANVLVLNVKTRTAAPGDQVPDSADLVAQVNRAGWGYRASKPICSDCQAKTR